MLNALTIDVEDYFMVSAFADTVKFDDWPAYESRVEQSTMRILDLLEGFNVKATFFMLGWVAEHHPGLATEIRNRGHEIALHGYNHRLAYELTRSEFREDIRKSKRIIEDITGSAVKGYRAPSYSITKKNLWALDVLIEEGFAYDSSIFPIYHDRYGYPEFDRFPLTVTRGGVGSILEVPLSTVRLMGRNIPIAGGGYLRLLPISFVEWGIRSINKKEGKHAVIYLHPWEIDPGQPRLNGSRLSSFRHNVNIGKTHSKLKRLLQRFRFGTMTETFAAELGA
ncbi:MAG TPA: XrtA system polysaccharide deacetylase [Thermodesulfobacteriota bacterium]|nr:XrtA system polysaccharide deacetylase [Thermodesulfobacteriota bacterium]